MTEFKIANLSELVSNAANFHNLKNYEIKIQGTTEKGEGFSGQIFFVNLVSESAIVNLAVKCSTTNKNIRKQISLSEACLKEIYIYKQVLPTFEKYLLKNEKLHFMTQCYSTHVVPRSEILVFENLREQGFKLWDKQLYLPTSAIRLLLEGYGQWHALSFALRHKNPQIYSKLTENNVNMFSKLAIEAKFLELVQDNLEKSKQLIVNEENKKDFQELLKITNDVVRYSFTDLFDKNPERHVILHGDCWNNNYLFKFDHSMEALAVKILDWQGSGVGVPIFDLSHFIYGAVNTGIFSDVKETLNIYYQQFSNCLKTCGLNPEEIYSFDQLVQDWKNYSKYGLAMSCFVVKTFYITKDEIPNLSEEGGARSFQEAFSFGNAVDERYIQRIRNNFIHYCKNVK